ncbi:MAG: AraC family transcriptional regulator [Patescibacteria group bacterium]
MKNTSLINTTDAGTIKRIAALGQKLTAILPFILTPNLLEHCERSPNDFVSAVGAGLERLGERVERVSKATSYIEAHSSKALSLGQVAKEMGLNDTYFCKLFKKEIGFNFTYFVSRVRIEKAKILLLSSESKVSVISREVGFTSLTHFNRTFKKLVGTSPTEYRKVEKAKNLLLNAHFGIQAISENVGFTSLTHFGQIFKKLVGTSPAEYRRGALPPVGQEKTQVVPV